MADRQTPSLTDRPRGSGSAVSVLNPARESSSVKSHLNMEAPLVVTATKVPLNINLGLVGHIDSGKTSLAKALSTHASTAAFDKNPQVGF